MGLNKRQKDFLEAYGKYSAKSSVEFREQRKLIGLTSLPSELKTLELINALLLKCTRKTVSLNDFLDIEKEIEQNENLVELKEIVKEKTSGKNGLPGGISIQNLLNELYIASEKLMIIKESEKMEKDLGNNLLPSESERKVLKNKW